MIPNTVKWYSRKKPPSQGKKKNKMKKRKQENKIRAENNLCHCWPRPLK